MRTVIKMVFVAFVLVLCGCDGGERPPGSTVAKTQSGKLYYDRILPGDCDAPHRDVLDEAGNMVGCDRRPG